ncbi:hypothetical protein ANCDUO_15372, partial [Ancylostoma duodenale]
AARGWMWLCCNEVGFMQTTEGGIFGATVPLQYYIDMCTDMFDASVTMDYLVPRNKAAQTYYGGSDKYTGFILEAEKLRALALSLLLFLIIVERKFTCTP